MPRAHIEMVKEFFIGYLTITICADSYSARAQVIHMNEELSFFNLKLTLWACHYSELAFFLVFG
jgi:hypothetical protein